MEREPYDHGWPGNLHRPTRLSASGGVAADGPCARPRSTGSGLPGSAGTGALGCRRAAALPRSERPEPGDGSLEIRHADREMDAGPAADSYCGARSLGNDWRPV